MTPYTTSWAYLSQGNTPFNIIVTGSSRVGTKLNYYTIKYDPSGNVLWAKSYDGGSDDSAYSVATDSNNNIIVTGSSRVGTNLNYYTIKYDPSGNVLWVKSYDGGSDDSAYAVATDSNNNIIVTGSDYYTIKYDTDGNILWSRSYATDDASDITVDSYDNFILVGTIYSYALTYYDYYTIKCEGPRKGKEFMITFDDGPGSVSTPYILDQLKNIKKADGTYVKAGFFLVGEDKSLATCYDIWQCNIPWCLPFLHPIDLCPDPGVISNPGIVQRIAREGHLIGIHTQHHPDLEYLEPKDVEREILDCYNTIISYTGVTPIRVFRSPYLHDPVNVPISLQVDWMKIRGDLTGDPTPFISEEAVINNCRKIIEQTIESPVTLIFHDFRGLPSHRFNFVNIVNELVKEGYVPLDFDPAVAAEMLNTSPSNTLCGENILVILPTGNFVRFSKVINAGDTDTTIVETGPPVGSDYVLLGNYYDVTTTAIYSGPVTVTFAYDVANQEWVRLLHYKDGQWVDITNPDQPDIFDGMISGTVDNLSLFAVVYSRFMYGDVSGDGEVTSYDAALVSQCSVGLIQLSDLQRFAADVSGNGCISAYDAALIAQYAVGLITVFPVEQMNPKPTSVPTCACP